MRRAVRLRLAGFYTLVITLFFVGTFLGNRAVTVISESQNAERAHTVVIDPGHGGEDGGATSCTGQRESAYNLEISLRLRDLLRLLGCRTVMTRTTDTSIYTRGETIAEKKISDLKERVRIADLLPNSTLVSIHQNTFPESKYSGAQVFYAATPGSEVLAKQLQDSLIAALNPGSSRGIKKGEGIYLMEHIQCCGILVECGFLSNPQEERRLASAEYQQRLVQVIAAAVCGNLSRT